MEGAGSDAFSVMEMWGGGRFLVLIAADIDTMGTR